MQTGWNAVSIDLKQLSARLGLSQTTVSRALNGYTDVSAKTRERVAQMAQELGYQPNSAARRLARGQADAVGIVYPLEAGDLGDPNFLFVVEGMSERLEAEDMDLLIASARSHAELRTYDRLLRGGRVDGVIVARTQVEDARIDYLRTAGFPFVAYGRTGRCDDFSWFDFDNEAGGAMAVRELVRLGHRDIACVLAPQHLNFAAQRRAGFLRALSEAGLPVRAEAVIETGLSRRAGYEAAQCLLALSPRPTAIFVDDNLCGIGVVRALLDQRVEIGRDISVIVYDGVPPDTLLVGQSVDAIEQPTAHEAGRTLADMLLRVIRQPDAPPQQVLRQPVFAPGSSVGPAP